jgi:hypothetical protein
MCIVSKIKGRHTISPTLFPIRTDANRINTAYTRAGINKTGETNHPSINERVVATTVKGGAK